MITLDYTFMTDGAVSGGIPDTALAAAAERFAMAHAAVMNRWKRGELGFLGLPDDEQQVRHCHELTRWATDRGVRDVVVLGIGGSALGPIALRTSLLPSSWNALSPSTRDGRPRLHVLDNVDPATMKSLLERLELGATLLIVTSKSGGTAETMAQYLVVRDRLEAAGRPAREHLVFVTDPEQGALRRIAANEKITALAVPPNVGGRFSVLSPVGLLPAALTGVDIAALLRGAKELRDRCGGDWARNPAGTFAMLQWLADTHCGRHGHVFMPYADALRDWAAWFVQLWAESLGKRRNDGTHVGPTPIAALGATDQHSQVQLFMEGPNDKTVTFVRIASDADDLRIPARHADIPDLAYLGGHTLGELLAIEQKATSGALAARGRMNMTLTLDALDASHVGGLIMLLELATAYAGELYGVNAFDQPGVELGKRFTYGMFGRKGFEQDMEAFKALPQSDPKRRV